ncbi:GTP-dependent dephospho-CoA kinase family protein [Ferroplasma sp.]|uniref:GTP-dependent dephospho-CoA kinase family protein n=1 Tax=Ferroplasma sp. TaxID=2591003 RepID=UPI002631683E|nr:DUF359 domain-containing protein [Ferroplasma sp.]MCL4453519.1 DUF359 domain-containing protein [Candidatus Thermoplasmatota archaeon]
MPLKLDHDIAVGDHARNAIKSFKYSLCNLDDIRLLAMHNKIVSVGDVTTEKLLKAGIEIKLQVVDLVTKRDERHFEHVEGSCEVANPPGTISLQLMDAIAHFMGQDKIGRIEVSGEEDLAVIPIIFYADNNTVIVYGVPDTGMAFIKVNEDIKKEIENMIMEMYGNEQ